jgi:glycolate oxidase FAD binding subunit
MEAMNVSLQSLHAGLDPLVGGSVRVAADADTVAGVRPQLVVEPGNEEQVSAVLAFANREGLKVLVRGGGTQLGLGFPPTGGDILLSTARLNQLVEHAPHDMTATVQAGMRLADLQSALANARQWLALDPLLGPRATIGGIIATNASGPRRLRYGGVRDQIIGVRVVLPDGTIAKGGGKVVKNVAGYDLHRLFTGSLGTLGVIVAANFRLYPLPAASRTVELTAPELAPLCDLAVRVNGSTLMPTILDILSPTTQDGAYRLIARFEMEQEAADDQAAGLVEMAGSLGRAAQTIASEAEAELWSQVDTHVAAPSSSETTLVLKASVLLTEMGHWLASLQETIRQAKLSARWRAHAGHGLIFVRLFGDDAALVTAIEALRQVATRRQGSLVVLEAPPPLLRQVDVWGTSPALEVMQRLKARFDPHATLNPGRFVGGI